MKQKPSDLKTRMLSDAMLILSSVSFLEKQILKKTAELEEATNNNLIKDFARIEKELQNLLKKIKKEEAEMDSFMLKYKKEVENEKKAILSHSK